MSKVLGFHTIGSLHRLSPNTLIAKYQQAGGAVSILIDKTFGDDLKKLKPLLVKPDVVIATLVNGAGLRNQRLQKGELAYGHDVRSFDKAVIAKDKKLLDPIKRRLENFNKLVPQNKRLLVSFSLEHNLSAEGALSAYTWLKDQGYEVIDNPLERNYQKIPGAYNESHGHNKTGLDIISHDGLDASDCNFYGDRPYQQAASFVELYWILENNLNYSGLKEFIAPRDRKWPVSEYDLQYKLALMRPAEKMPRINGVPVLKAPSISKTRAENYKTQDKRGGLPVFIIKEKVSHVRLLTLEGKHIVNVPYYKPFQDLHRYYIGGFTSHTHFTLFKANGQREWLILEAGNNRYLINIFRRVGTSR